MSNGNRKEFLNNGILGGGAGIADKRSFRAVRTEYITSPDYDPKYFETFPTAWAAAYAFRKVLDLPARPGTTGEVFFDDVSQAVEEWSTLFLLHYFGVVYLSEFNENELRKKYDKDLWLALSGTYPSAREQAPRSIRLLQTRTGTVVGAYYPAVIFFPARDRTHWTGDEALQDYIRDGQLSWAASKRTLFVGDQEERDFHTHLRLIADHGIPNSTLKDRLHEFSQREFPERIDLTEAADNIDREVLRRWSDPAVWKIPGRTEWEPSQLLEMYPLQKENQGSSGARPGRTFYMVTGLPSVSWMKTAIAPGGPAPYQYRKLNDNQIVVELPGRKFTCDKREDDRIEVLKDGFLKHLPHWCKVPKAADAHTQRIQSLHRVGKLRDQVLFDNEIAVCLAPVTLKFLQSFPELMEKAEQVVSVEPNADATTVTWVFKLMNKEIRWQTALSYSKGIAQASLALWPPKLSTKWKLYAAYGIGGRQDSGRWNLVDERGELGERFEVEENEEYISVLHGTTGHPNRPRALMLHDSEGHERGVLFLADLDSVDPHVNPDPTVLAVDFGTSNTCFAYDDGVRAILRFGLAPEILWGKKVDEKRLEHPGFVPFRWGGSKGFFPTVLLSRISDQSLTDQLLPKDANLHHLFKVDVPCLHRELEDRLFYGQLDKVWKIHASLKWDVEGKTEPWRTLFLQLTLLYAHAEMSFNRRRMIDRYIFTFPLAYSREEQERFHAKAMAAVHKIRHYCYGSDLNENLPYAELKQELTYEDAVDESTAVAAAIRAPEGASNMEVFVDVGGGTADIAIRHNGRFLVLDSLKVAGNTFFNFAATNFSEAVCGAPDFKKHLGRLLQGKEGEVTLPHLNNSPDFRLNVFYSVAVNSLGDEEFRDREHGILKKGMGPRSYQKFRTRLFFRHLIAYALLQSCAAVVDNKLKLSSGINLILGGNGWGLMLFAELPRQRRRIEEEAKEILKLLKSRLSKDLSKEAAQCLAALEKINVNLLNESDLSKAKTNVALGALNADPQGRDSGKTAPYGGVTLRDFQVHGRKPVGKKSPDLNWWDRWSFEEMKERFGFMDAVKDVTFRTPENQEQPLDETLAIFSCVGNVRGYEQDNMPPEIWNSINTAIMKNLRELSADRMGQAPINYFLSKVLYEEKPTLDFLDALAKANDHFKS